MTERSENREPSPKKGVTPTYTVIPEIMTPDERRRKFFSCFYPRNLDGTVRVTNIMDALP